MADMELATSVPKDVLVGRRIIAHNSHNPSDSAAGKLADRVARAFGRFPFPGEVYPAFKKFRSRVQDRAGGQGAFGFVLDAVTDLRVAADQWLLPGRNLILYVVVPQDLLVPIEDYDDAWAWTPARVTGLRSGEARDGLNLTRVSDLIRDNLAGDKTTLGWLWTLFGERLERELLQPVDGVEVASFAVEVISETEMTLFQYSRTESLDLEVLSDSPWPSSNGLEQH